MRDVMNCGRHSNTLLAKDHKFRHKQKLGMSFNGMIFCVVYFGKLFLMEALSDNKENANTWIN